MSETLSIAMDEAEEMMDLKKAYADMILNTAKEAGARVLAAERRARNCEHDRLYTKEEAIRMLLRLKQLIEVKNIEAEVASMDQQKKIQDLELQLDEAEGLILDLRAKLSMVQEQLDDAKRKSNNSLRGKERINMSSCHPSVSGLESHSVASELQTPILDHQCPGPVKETLRSNSDFDNCLVDNPVFDFIYFRNKEPELCCNGCMQRICATEKSLLDEKMPLPSDPDSLRRIISVVQKNEKLWEKIVTPSTNDKVDSKEASSLEVNAPKDWSLKVQKLRRRRARYGKAKGTGCRDPSGQCVKPQRTFSVIGRCRTYPVSGKKVDISGNCPSDIHTRNKAKNGFETEQKRAFFPSHCKEDLVLAKYETVSVARRSIRKRKVKHWDGFATSCRPEGTRPRQNDKPFQKIKGVYCSTKSDEHQWEGTNETEFEDSHVKFVNISECMKASGDSGVLHVAEDDSELTDVPMLVKHSLTQLQNVLSFPSEVKATPACRLSNKEDAQHDSNKSFTYTFSRKRKKGWLSDLGGGNYFSGESYTRRSMKEQSNIDFVPQTDGLVNELSNDSRGLVQVAHQLISLSGKKW